MSTLTRCEDDAPGITTRSKVISDASYYDLDERGQNKREKRKGG